MSLMFLTWTKRCSKCGEEKDNDQFYRDQGKRDGLHGMCKTCDRAYAANYRQTPGYRVGSRQGCAQTRAKHRELGPSICRTHKRCIKCDIDKPIEEFHRNSTKADGHNDWCKTCFFGWRREWRREQQKQEPRHRA